jgi:hypothetical protein
MVAPVGRMPDRAVIERDGIAHVAMDLLLESVAPFPTRSEIWLKLLERYEAQRRLGGLARAA